jgi:hypothetical protein
MNTYSKWICAILLILPFTVQAVEWSPISWSIRKLEDGKIVKEALLVTAQISDIKKPFYFQLDTGTQDSFLFMHSIGSDQDLAPYFQTISSAPVPKNEYKNVTDYGVKLDGKIINSHFSKEPFFVNTRLGARNSPLIGIVGLSVFSKPVLAIDFINNRVAVASNTDEIGNYIKFPIIYEKYSIIGSLPALPVSSGGKSRGNFVVDTGANQFGMIIFDIEKWSEMTGRKIDDVENKQIDGNNWNDHLTCKQAPALTPIEFNYLSLGRIDLAYCMEGNRPMKVAGIDGMVGNAAFLDRAVLIFDQSTRRIGISFQSTSRN